MIPQGNLGSAVVGSTSVLTLTYNGSSLTNLSIGNPSATREVVFMMNTAQGVNADPATAVTIGGVAATRDYLYGNYGKVGHFEVWRAVVPTGTTATITENNASALKWYSVWVSSEPLMFVGGATDSFTQGDSVTSLSCPAVDGGFVIAGYATRETSAVSATWSGVDEAWDVPGGQTSVSGGFGIASGTSLTVSATFSAPIADLITQVMGAACYRLLVLGETIYDSFDRSDSALGLGIATSGHTWRHSSTGLVGITGNQAYRVSGYPTYAWVNYGLQDMMVTVKNVVNGTYWPVVGARANADGSGGYSVAKDSPTMVKLTGYGGTFTMADGDIIGLRVVEGSGVTNVSLLLNGVTKITWPDSSAGRPTGTYAKLDMGNQDTVRADNFRVEPASLRAFDTFDRADSNTLGLLDTGQLWVNTDEGIGVGSNKAKRVLSYGISIVDTEITDMKVSCDVSSVTAYDPVIFARHSGGAQASATHYQTQRNNVGRYTLDRYVAGTGTMLLTAPSTPARGDTLGISVKEEAGGTRINMIINGVVDATYLDTVGSRPLTGTYAGFSAQIATTTIDNFKVEKI